MKIGFFEEFPTDENLKKIKMVNFSTMVFVAAKSLEEYAEYEKILKKLNRRVKVGYWPVLRKEEGYWLSPFAKTEALRRTISELELHGKPIDVLWDAELPLIRKRLFLTELPHVLENRRMIKNFLTNAKNKEIKVYTAEYDYRWWRSKLFEFLMLHFSPKKCSHTRIEMLYSSFLEGPVEKFIIDRIKRGKRLYENYFVSVGCIDIGILENERKISPKELDRDLRICKNHSVDEVFIFRLGGLDKRYLCVIKNYI